MARDWPALRIRFDLGGLTPIAEERFSKEVHRRSRPYLWEYHGGMVSELSEYIESLVVKVADDLGRMYASSDVASKYGLIFPEKRNGSLRISEQEAKLLFVQHLTVDRRFAFSVETPTKETYQQTGKTGMSARVDITLYGRDRRAEAHIELKAHNCPVESIRKDLEKLLRERTMGIWFHTLERAGSQTLATLMRKFRDAFSAVAEHVRPNDKSFLMCFAVLESGVLTRKWLRLTGDLNHNLAAVEEAFQPHSSQGAWLLHRFRPEHELKRRRSATKGASRGKGSRQAYFVFVPTVASDTLLHLSIRGGSYRLRKFVGSGRQATARPFTLSGYPTFGALQESNLISRWIPVSDSDLAHSLEREPDYWANRIRMLSASELE